MMDEMQRQRTPSLALMGMRGVGKTTLGRLAAEHLEADFIDADTLFVQLHSATPKEFVARHGWPSFRQEETAILKSVLEQMRDPTRQKPLVISLGGGVVEEEVNRTMLKASWTTDESEEALDVRKRIGVIHVFRELDKVLLDKRGMPSWTGVVKGDDVWQRRRPWYRECSSHEFVNFTEEASMLAVDACVEESRAARLQFEAVERDFVHFLKQLLASFSPNGKPYLPSARQRSYLVTLPFADLRPHVDKLPLLTLGADAVELRADLLNDPTNQSNGTTYENPSLSFLSEQIGLIRRHLPGYPLVFTLRTPAQGGRYPYPDDAPSEALFTSLRHALKLGCDVLDIEMGLDDEQTTKLIQEAKHRHVAVLVSWRDQLPPSEGGFHWGSGRAREIYQRAVCMGADIVKIVGSAEKVSDNFALRVFAASVEEEEEEDDPLKGGRRPMLSAYNMGYRGRISRFLNPTLASVTHPLAKELSKRGVVGNPSMTFEEIQRALHLSGLIENASFFFHTICADEAVERHIRWSKMMGLPFRMIAGQWPQGGLHQMLQDHNPRFGDVKGICFPDGIRKAAFSETIIDDENVRQTGFFDCIIVQPSSPKSLIVSNKLVEALADLISSSISPSIHINQNASCVILANETSDDKSSMVVFSAVQAGQRAGLGNVAVYPMYSAPSDKAAPHPLVIINCREGGEAVKESLLRHPDGGLYVDLYDNGPSQRLVNVPHYKHIGWRSIDHDTVWRQVDAFRFRTFTGRRAPSALADTLGDDVENENVL